METQTQPNSLSQGQQLAALTSHCLARLDHADIEQEPLYLRMLNLIGFGEFIISALDDRTTADTTGRATCSIEQYGGIAPHIDELLAAVPTLEGTTSARSFRDGAQLTVSFKVMPREELEKLAELTIAKCKATGRQAETVA